MYKSILIPVALNHNGTIAPALGIARILRADGGSITALSVVEPVPSFVKQYLPDGQIEKNCAATMTDLLDNLHGADDVKPEVLQGNPGLTILEFAAKTGIDLIVVASHKPGLQDFFLGSTAARVVRHAQCSVHVLR